MAGKTINILLLDEILDSLDDDNSEIAVDIMRSLSKEFLVMIISHSHKSWIVSDNDIRL
jgi:DNA repair exonuclease SbcCD ATPase subunit